MSLYGSSPFNIPGYTFYASSGPKGPQGEQGPQGPKGNPGYGPAGPSGSSIATINFINGIINTIYSNGTIQSSNTIEEITGNYVLDITAATGGQFSPLASIDQLYDQTVAYDQNAQSNQFEFVKRLNFKNIKTNSSPFIELAYVGPPETPENEPGQTIKMTYSVFNLGASNVSGGPDGALVINEPGNIQSGYTGTTYSIDENASSFAVLNAAEQLVVVKPYNFGSTNIQVWAIDPSIGSIFYLKDYKSITQTTDVYGHHIMIKKDVTTNSSKALTVIFPKDFSASSGNNRIFYSTYDSIDDIVIGNFSIDNFKLKFSPNIVWQNDSYFCPSNNNYDAVNFISIGSRYVGIPGIYNTALNTRADSIDVPTFGCKPSNLENFYRIAFNARYGLCCNTDCTCELMYDFDCSGYFYEGATCGGISGPCSDLGACCIYSQNGTVVVPCQELTFCQCAGIATDSDMEYSWNRFTEIKKSCADFNCSNTKNGIGACCDGIGGCTELTETECIDLGGYYQGNGVNCTTSDGFNVCYDGSGGCCDSGLTCSPGITGSVCLSENKTYFGDGTTCGVFNCSAADIPCYSIIEGNLIYPGTEYEDGIVVGIFNPNRSRCFGPDIFSGLLTRFPDLAGTTLQASTEYLSSYDYSGYGFDPSTTCEADGDTYLMIVSKHPINLDSSKNIIDGDSGTHEFIWSNGSVAWGPLIDITSLTVNEFDINNLSFKEGYVYDALNESSSKLALYSNSFLTCSSARFDTNANTFLENRPVQSFTGNWTRNYGLYNTIRLVSAEYFYYNIGSSSYGATLENYIPQTSDITAARAISIYNRQLPKQESFASDWYIPSIDELGYLANHCKNTSEFNINSRLLELGYTPMIGLHWSSTGALNISSNEGINTASGITHGSEAWAINIDVDGNTENMFGTRVPRTNQYQIRPIKLIRCDKRYYLNSDENNRLWTIPLLSESIIDNQ